MNDKQFQIEPKRSRVGYVTTIEHGPRGSLHISIRADEKARRLVTHFPFFVVTFLLGTLGILIAFRKNWAGGSNLELQKYLISLAGPVVSSLFACLIPVLVISPKLYIDLEGGHQKLVTKRLGKIGASYSIADIANVVIANPHEFFGNKPILYLVLKNGKRKALVGAVIGIDALHECAVAISNFLGFEPDPEWLPTTNPLSPYPRPKA